jgi:UDP-N-acetylglucosamine--N-acetylmuramyl-(pentapeptide) pyrophosphoryl-undecaprenol N-acetylglucosamine transferase
MEKFFPADKISISGNPVRNAIAHSQVQREDALRYFGLQKGKKTVLSVGGSLGAKSINEAIGKHLDLLMEKGIQLIWQTGTAYQVAAEELCKGREGVYVNAFITEMPNAYAAADFVISRSGAMAVSELCIVGKPVIFVPFPYAAEDHQRVNAQKLVNNHAAMLIEDKEALNKLVPAVLALSKNSSLQESLSYHISQMAIYDADQKIAEEILSYLN